MVEEARDEYRAERISAVFTLLTGKLEDAAQSAVDGQGRHADDQLRACAEDIAVLSSEVAIIANVLVGLLGDYPSAPLSPCKV